MAALAHDLRAQIPDLAGQFEDSRPSQRRNTGFGLFTETIVDRKRPLPDSGPTGDLGTAHAMVAHLPDPIAFKVRVRNGVLLGLFGDSYGQDTRAIDFATAAFDQVFTVDAQGRSVPFEAAASAPPASSPRSQEHHRAPPAPVAAPAPTVAPVVRTAASVQKTQDVARRTSAPAPVVPPASRPQDIVLDQLFGAKRPGDAADAAQESTLTDSEKAGLRVGLWFALFVIVGVLVLIFDMNIVFPAIAAVFLGRALQTDAGLAAIKRGIDEWKKAQTKAT